jgi:hypothetical protein
MRVTMVGLSALVTLGLFGLTMHFSTGMGVPLSIKVGVCLSVSLPSSYLPFPCLPRLFDGSFICSLHPLPVVPVA